MCNDLFRLSAFQSLLSLTMIKGRQTNAHVPYLIIIQINHKGNKINQVMQKIWNKEHLQYVYVRTWLWESNKKEKQYL